MPFSRPAGVLLFVFLLLSSFSCIRRKVAPPELELVVNSGIRDVMRLGDSQGLVEQNAKWPVTKPLVKDDPTAEQLGCNLILEMDEIGARAYFRRGRVVLIRIQTPFQGTIRGGRLKVFTMSAAPPKGWEEYLVRELGEPYMRASGGTFGSEALFFTWGDISYNHSGPNEIAIYREPDITTFRQRNFGRDMRLFKN